MAVSSFSDIDESIAMANDSRFGLSAGIFTQNVGGLKDSGMGKEGPAYAVQEMTELKMVVFHL